MLRVLLAYFVVSTRGDDPLPDEAHTELITELPNSVFTPADTEQSNRTEIRPWGRGDRNRLLIWAGIGFGIPAFFLFGLHWMGGASRSVMSVQTDLPLKGLMAFSVALATVIVSRIEKRSLGDYGIPLRQSFGLKFWEGSVWGFTVLSLLLLGLRSLGAFRIESMVLERAEIFRSALGWGCTFLAVSLHEELAFRGYWLFTMSRRMRFWPAALFLSAVFGAAHLGNHGETVIGILHVFATGLLFCLMIRRTGTLWFVIGYHAAWDWAETFFYGTPDSGLLGVGRLLNSSAHGPDWLTGGSAGPEGSIFSIVALLLCATLIHLRFPEAIYPDRPN